MNRNIILIMGPQGSGKSTQGKLLAQAINYKFISTGDLIRNATKEQVDAESWEQMKKGNLVSDKVVESLLFPVLQDESFEGFILDGYPRTEDQIKTLTFFMDSHNLAFYKAVYVYISEEESFNRISKRALIESRPDENPEILKNRLSLYYKNTQPLLDKYNNMGILIEIDGERSIEMIQSDILKHFSDK